MTIMLNYVRQLYFYITTIIMLLTWRNGDYQAFYGSFVVGSGVLVNIQTSFIIFFYCWMIQILLFKYIVT